MLNFKLVATLLAVTCLLTTALTLWWVRGVDSVQIQTWLQQAGIWAPVVYIAVYVIATMFVLPSTALNLTGGAIFGPWLGVLWTTIAAIAAALLSFTFTRTIGREIIAARLSGQWQALDTEIRLGGVFYIFAIRLLPIIPYGLVNFTAGLTSVSFKDYLLGTLLGTTPGILPFVLMGSFGLTALKTGEILPLLAAMGLAALLIAIATWYRHRPR